ncbi:MAG TPA: M1 family metallopeptidase [Pseudonocardiaceae bacterium]|jgi:aminopeptidase N|nr:M1 family metallopeptidase [Pseudonocardiaceae bacterium]
MLKRVLIGLTLALLAVVAIVAVPWRAAGPGQPGAAPASSRSADPAPPRSAGPPRSAALHPVPGAEGIGDPYFPRAGNGGYDVTGYDITLRYDPATDKLVGRTTVTARTTIDLSRFNLDLMLPATAAEVDGHPAAIRQHGGELQVTPAGPLPAGRTMVVRVDYAGVPSSIAGGTGPARPWTRTPDGAVAVGQPDIAAWWYPSNDHPSDKALMTVTATVPAGVEAISNGALLGGPEPVEPGWQRWRWRAAEPMAPYLAFVAIGQYELVRRDTPAGPYLAAYAQGLDPQVARGARAAVERTPEIVGFLSGLFGSYPFSQLGGVVPDAPEMYFALENQTRPVYGPIFFEGGAEISVVVHELAHQWFGDSVSVQRWRDIWLNEGFATYAEWLYSERHGGPSTAQIATGRYREIPADADFWRIPPGDPGAAGVLDGPVYVRGAMALQALRGAVGDEAFFAALRAWAAERRGGNGTVEEFLAVVERVSGKQVGDVAAMWLFRPERPGRAP